MTAKDSLTGSHLRTYDRIFQHPISHNLAWREVHALLNELGEVVEEHNGNLKVTRNGQVLVLHEARTKDVAEMDELMSLRHFLERSEKVPVADQESTHWLLVIDHHEARIFTSVLSGGIPEKILPHQPEEFFRHAHNSREESRGQEKPDPQSFFEPVAKALGMGTGRILIFGTGTGTSSEAEQFSNWVKIHHPPLATRIAGLVAVDEHHLSEGQLLAKAREFYSTPVPLTQNV